MSKFTPRRLQKQVDEWREARVKKLAARLQIHSNKSREVSAQVFGIPAVKSVHLPTPPSAKTDSRFPPPSIGQMRKSLSYGDVHNYQHRQSTFSQDHRNGMNRQETRNPYVQNYSQGYHQSHGHHQMHAQYQEHPRSPHHYNSHDYRSQNPQRSGPGGYRNAYVPSSPSKYRVQHYSSAPNVRNMCKGIRKTNDQPQGSKLHCNNKHKDAGATKSLIPKEKTVTFEDQNNDCTNKQTSDATAAPTVTSLVLNTEVETNLNTTFNIEDGQNIPGDSSSADKSDQVEVITSTEELFSEEFHVNDHDVSAVESSIVEQEIVVITSEVEKVDDTMYQDNYVAENSVNVPLIVITNPENEKQIIIENECFDVNRVADVCQSGSAENHGPEESPVQAEGHDSKQPVSQADEHSAVQPLKQPEEHERLEHVEEHPTEEPLKQSEENSSENPLKLAEEPPTELSLKHSFVINEVDNSDSSFSLSLEVGSSPEVANKNSTDIYPDVEEETGEIFYPASCSVEESVIQLADSTVAEPTPLLTSPPDLSACNIRETAADNGQEEIHIIKQQEEVSVDQEKPTGDSEIQKLELSTPEPKKSPLIQEQSKPQSTHVEEVTENLDALYITPVRASRKSRVLVDSTNIVESSSIKYVVRDVKNKEKESSDIIVTPVRRSTRKKADTPGSAMKVVDDEIILTKAKVIPNPFLKI